jgi:hypothetical protein
MMIRPEQVTTLKHAVRQNFEEEMVQHARQFSPRLCEVIGDEQLHVAVHDALERAKQYDFTCRGPLRLFVELMFLCGSSFDTDPQYQAIGRILRGPEHEMLRAQQIHEGQVDYLEKVSGPDVVNVRNALRDLLTLARSPLPYSPDTLAQDLLQEMTRIFPQKVAYLGKENLTLLIDRGLVEARQYQFSTVRQQTLIVVLMFAFGHGCTADPLYPWISRTLSDDKIVSPAARAERLEKKAVTWLDHVLARPKQGPEL